MKEKCEISENQREAEIDWLRGFAAFLVILGHAIIVFPVNLHEIFWCKYLYNVIYSFHMPLFFAISGYCYSIRGGGYCTYLIKKAKRLLIPYFVFAFGGIIPRLLLPGLVNGSETIRESIINILFHGGEYWFLYTLFIIFALFPLVAKAINRNCWMSVLGIFLLGMLRNRFPNTCCIRSVVYYMFFFTIGYVSRQKKYLKRVKESIQCANTIVKESTALVSIIIVLFLGYIHGKYDFILIRLIEASVGIIACSMVVVSTPGLLGVFGKFSEYSLCLYLLNGYWLVISRTIAVNILKVYNPLFIIIFNMIVDFYLSYLLIRFVLSKLPIIRTLIGIR